MKNLFVLMGLFLCVQVAFAQKSTDNFEGKWKSEDGQIIEITKNEGVFLGTASKNGKKS
ncbi:MAG: hypothetical protein HC913_09140 [Microscillaceae bacterium]|nr:hypothetical protein [Microscillaceae bacterium]